MGLCIEADESEQGVDVEIRNKSVIFIGTGVGDKEMFSCVHSDLYGWYVEVDKTYLKKLIEFFNEHPEHLEVCKK